MNNLILFFRHVVFGLVAMGVASVWPARLAAQPSGERAVVEPTWTRVAALPNNRPASAIGVRAQKFKGFQLNQVRLRRLLIEAPQERSHSLRTSSAIIELPMPDGTLARYRFVEAPVMSPELAAKFPEIKTYLGEGVDDPATSVRFDFTPAGFHAQILSPSGTIYIDPAFRGETDLHTSYYKRDHPRPQDGFQCLVATDAGVAGRVITEQAPGIALGLERSGGMLRTYRLAVGATAEYTAFHGGTVAGGLAAIVTAVNRVTAVYESELAIRLELVANNHLIVYTNASTDPYSNGNPSSLLSQNQSTLDKEIGSANYDIGHVFSTAGGGLAALGVVCVNGMKAQGETGMASPIGDPFYIDYVAHEIGHQFGANHTFNSSTSNCGGGNRNGSNAYERGSGSTIMGYAGICGSDNLQANSDPYFHSASFDEILGFTTGISGGSCALATATGNNAPSVNAGNNFTIPQSTPFILTATGSDPDGDPLTFCWEQRDLGPATTVSAPDNGSGPLFRSWSPSASPSRTFPRLQNLLSNTLPLGEVLPTTTRTMNFRVTARDNRAGGGGVSTSDMQVSVTAAAGPFLVTSHNSGGTFSGVQNVTWNVAGTASAPVSTANVNILLSTNGGLSFPIILLADTPNDGSELVVLPNLNSTSARIKVEAAGNIYFDIGNTDFTIIPDIPTPLVTIEGAVLIAEDCSLTNNAIDPGENVTVNFTLRNIGTADLTNLVATLLTTNGVMATSATQTYGALLAGGGPATLPFSFTASGACGESFAVALALREGENQFGQVNYHFELGTQTEVVTSGSNPNEITIPAEGSSGAASPFPSTITVSGVQGTLSKVTVTLKGFSHTWPADVDALLIGPNGQRLVLLSDAGGGHEVSELTLTFDDEASGMLSDVGALSSGTFKPTDYGGGDSFSSPAPGEPYGATLAVFNGVDPNGEWSLYVQDDASQDVGSLAMGWQLNLTTSNASCCDDNPAISELVLRQSVSASAVNLGSNVTFSLMVSNSGPDAAAAVVVTNHLPVGFDFVSAGSSRGTVNNAGGLQIFNVGALANGEFAVLAVEAAALLTGARSNLAITACSTHDPVYTNNTVVGVVFVNAFPLISTLTNVINNEDSVAGPLAFTVADTETPSVALVLSAVSSNTNLLPSANIVFGGVGSNRSLTITPANNQSGSSVITISVFDGLAVTKSSFTATFLPVNDPPRFLPGSDFIVYEGESLVFTNAVTDPEAPQQTLLFSLSSELQGASVNPTDGVFAWTPGESYGGSTNLAWVIVTDDGVPSLSATQAFTILVLESNSAPEVAPIADFTITEGEALTFITSAADSDEPVNQLVFSLENAPAGAEIDPASGLFQWTPDEMQGPGTNHISVIVTDNGIPSLSATQSFTVMVLETNLAPELATVPEFAVIEGDILTFTNFASDSDVPVHVLVFSLVNAPTNATIDPTSGVFVWNTGEADGPATHVFQVIVADDGSPALSATQSVTVVVLETNSAPVLATIPDFMIHEGEMLTITNLATDADLPGNMLTFSLSDAPSGATINPVSGVFHWMVNENQGGNTNRISVIVTDDGAPGLSATQSFTVIVLESNTAPVLGPIQDYIISEGDTLSFAAIANDVDQPPDTLTFSLIGAPDNALIDSQNGWFTWTPAESQAPATNIISVIVTDNGRPGLSATQSFTVVVLEVNERPVLDSIADVSIFEGQTLILTNVAVDVDLPGNQLAFSLANAPTNAWIDPTNGVFIWMPGEAQGPSSQVISVIVTDDGMPSLSATQSFTVLVQETNLPPALAGISDFKIHAGMKLSFTNIATDPDTPPNALTFSLDSDAPAGAVIGAADGGFTWTPADTDANTVRSITVRVTDDGVPALDDAHTFLVTVVSRPTITGIQVVGDVAKVTWTALAGQGYRLQFKTNATELEWTDAQPDVIAQGASVTHTNSIDPSGLRFYRVQIVP